MNDLTMRRRGLHLNNAPRTPTTPMAMTNMFTTIEIAAPDTVSFPVMKS